MILNPTVDIKLTYDNIKAFTQVIPLPFYFFFLFFGRRSFLILEFIFSSCFWGGSYVNKIIIPLVNYVEYLLKISGLFFNLFYLINVKNKKKRLSNTYFTFYI